MIIARVVASILVFFIIIASLVFVTWEHFSLIVFSDEGHQIKSFPVMKQSFVTPSPSTLPGCAETIGNSYSPGTVTTGSSGSSSTAAPTGGSSGSSGSTSVAGPTGSSGSSITTTTTTPTGSSGMATVTHNPYDIIGGEQCLNWCNANNEQPSSVNGMTSEAMLSQHNQYRTKQGLPAMTWNQNAFCYARCTQKRCTHFGTAAAHDTSGSFSKFAQNLAWASYGIKQFYDEGAQNNCPLTAGWSYQCGHYDNMMQNRQVGCNYERCSGIGDGSVGGGVELRCNYA